MTQKHEIYRCEICGNIVEVLHTGQGVLVCCGQDMIKEEANTEDSVYESHLPVIETNEEGVHSVKIGSNPHPMEDNHYIEWIEIQIGDKIGKKFLNPSDDPVAKFFLKGDVKKARAYCNVHGLWEKINE